MLSREIRAVQLPPAEDVDAVTRAVVLAAPAEVLLGVTAGTAVSGTKAFVLMAAGTLEGIHGGDPRRHCFVVGPTHGDGSGFLVMCRKRRGDVGGCRPVCHFLYQKQ